MTPDENFKTNYNNPKTRQNFKNATGIDATANPAAFIAYLNNIYLDLIVNGINNLGSSVERLKRP